MYSLTLSVGPLTNQPIRDNEAAVTGEAVCIEIRSEYVPYNRSGRTSMDREKEKLQAFVVDAIVT